VGVGSHEHQQRRQKSSKLNKVNAVELLNYIAVSCLLLFMDTVAGLVAKCLIMKTNFVNNAINETNKNRPTI
jgi:hypothetical protein